AERFEALARGDERAAYGLARLLPTRGLQQREPARRLRFGRRICFETGQPRITANAFGDRGRDVPCVVWRCRENAETALAQMIVRAAAVERAKGRLEAEAAAKARRPQRRTDHLRAERRRKNARAHRRCRATARSAGSALEVVRIAHRH